MSREDLVESMELIAKLTKKELEEVTEYARQMIESRSDSVCNMQGGEEHAADECA